MIINPDKRPSAPRSPIPSSCSANELGAAFAAANLQSIPDPDKRARAFMDVLTRVMIANISDPAKRQQLIEARLNAARARR